MTLFRRVNDIFAANLNDLVDRIENPETMLRQAVRDMDDGIDAVTSAAARSIATQKLLASEIESQRAAAEQWQRQAAAAVTSGNDEAARRALVRRRASERLAQSLEVQRTTAHASVERLRHRIEMMKLKREEARRLLLELAARQCAADARRRLCSTGTHNSSGEVLRRFDRLRQRIAFAEAEAEALDELAEADDWIEERNHQDTAEIEAELVALKEGRVE